MFSSLGEQARAAALSVIGQGGLSPWAALDYGDPTINWPASLLRVYSIKSLLSNAKRQELLPHPPLSSDLDIFNDFPVLIYCLDYMQNRLHDGLSTTQEQRRGVSTHLISFWSSVLSVDWPDLVISQSAPHEVAEFALFLLCLHRGIPWITLQYNPWGHRPVRLSADAHGNLISIPIGISGIASFSTMSPQAKFVEGLLAEFRQTSAWEDRHDMRDAKSISPRSKIISYLLILLKASLKGFLLRDNSIDRALLRLRDIHRSSTITAFESDLDSNYVYFPLSYQPELTSCPLGGGFCDQLLAIRTIAAVLPEGWFVYVKEHPGQYLGHTYGYLGRTKLFYAQLNSIHKVRIVSSHVHSQRLIDGSRLVATLTGSAGYEALARSKNVITFGDVWYNAVDGCFRVYKPSDVKLAFQKALDHRIVPASVDLAFQEIAKQSFSFFGEKSSALSYGYLWDPCNEIRAIEEFLRAIPSLDLADCSI
jgi:hypothetical protein